MEPGLRPCYRDEDQQTPGPASRETKGRSAGQGSWRSVRVFAGNGALLPVLSWPTGEKTGSIISRSLAVRTRIVPAAKGRRAISRVPVAGIIFRSGRPA